MLLHQTHGANSSINLAYTTLPKYNLIVAKSASIPAKSIVHLPILDIHGYDNSYLHILYVLILQKYNFFGKYSRTT